RGGMRLTMPVRRGWRPRHHLGPARPAVLTQFAARPEPPRCSWRIGPQSFATSTRARARLAQKTVHLIQKLIADNEEAKLAWDRAVRGDHGGERDGAGRKPTAHNPRPSEPEG